MGNAQRKRKKKTTGSEKRISSGLPEVKCEKLCCKQLAFSWSIERLSGTVEEKKDALLEKLTEFEGDERKKAAISLLDFPGDSAFVSAAIMVIREINGSLSLGVLAGKAFKGRSYKECISILEKAGIEQLSDEIKEGIDRFCNDKTMDNDLFSINI